MNNLFLFALILTSVPARAGWFRDFCEKHLVGDAEDFYSTELTNLFANSRGALDYAQKLEERYVEIATRLVWADGTDKALAKRLQKIGNELRRIDPDCPALSNFRIYEDSL